MSDIPPIEARPGVAAPRLARPREVAADPGAVPVDRVEISETGQLLATLEHPEDIRADKVAAIREAIQNGTYETDEKIDLTVSRLLDALQAP